MKIDPLRDGIRHVGHAGDGAHRAEEGVSVLPGYLFYGADDGAGSQHGIVTPGDGHRAGVSRLAGDGNVKAAAVADAGHTGEGAVLLFEDGPLLYVELVIGAEPLFRDPGLTDFFRAEPGVQHGVPEGDSFSVHSVKPGGIPPACHGRAAEIGHAEARALFVRKTCYFHRMLRALSGLHQAVHCLYGREHAQRAVIGTGVNHGVEVRAQHDGREIGTRALKASADAAGCIDEGAHAGFLHPAAHKRRGFHGGRRNESAGYLTRHVRDQREFLQAGHDAVGCSFENVLY